MAVIPNPHPGGGSITTPVSVPNGGTGGTTYIAYAPVVGGTTATNPFQSVPALGTAGMPLTSQGAAVIPAFGPANAPVAALTDAATIAVDASQGNYLTVTIAGSRTMGAPSNLAAFGSQPVWFEIKQGVGGSHTVTWTSGAGGYSFGSGSAPTLSTTAGLVDLVGFRYSQVVGKLLFIGSETGYS